MLYYNQDMFDKAGIKVPTTVDDLYAAADAFVAKGITPFATGGAEYPAQQIFYMLALSKADRTFVTKLSTAQRHRFPWAGIHLRRDRTGRLGSKGYVSKNAVNMKAQEYAE